MLMREVQEEVLARLGRVGVAARHAVESLLAGQHRSVHRGLSVEFAGHRPYQPGDDLRHLDWRVWARTDRYDIKVFEEETRLNATLVVDYSGSMDYPAGDRSKLAYARMLAATLAFLMTRQGDSVGLVACDTGIRRQLPPSATMGHLLNVLHALEDEQPGGETGLGGVLEQVAERLRRRGLVILISDCFDRVEPLVRSLHYLRYRRQDVRVFQIVDPQEDTFALRGSHEFVGLEGERPLRLDADRVRHRYRETLATHRAALSAGCHAAGIAFNHCTTDEDLALFLGRTLAGGGDAPGGGQRR